MSGIADSYPAFFWEEKMEQRLTEGSVWKKLLWFTIPIFGANLLQAMYGTVDLMVVGLFADSAEVSAVSTGSMTIQTITGIVTGLTMGCTVLLGQNIGKGDEKAAARTIGSALWLFVTVGIVLAVSVIWVADGTAKVMNAPQEALSQTIDYIRICGGGILCIVLFNAISGMFRGIGDSRTPLIMMMIACVGNIAGDLLLVGLFGMKSQGAAIATIAAQGLSVVCSYFQIRKNGLGFPIDREALKPAKKETKQILRYGLPIAAQEALTGISFMIILAILNKFGLVASAGVGVAEKICGLIFIVPGAFMSAVSAFSAQNVGAGKMNRAKSSMYYGMGICCLVGIVMFAVSFFQGVWLAHFFTTDVQVMLSAADYLKSYSVDCLIIGFNFSMMGYLSGKGKTTFVSLQGIISTFLVRIPVSYFMSRVPGVTLFQVGFATPLATVFAILLDIGYLWYDERKNGESLL
jgi:putative MATE family efflux protein